jgi:hypothetical protein
VDAFGNSRTVPVERRQDAFAGSQLPQYLMLNRGQDVTPTPIDFGRNIASAATFSYSAPVKGDAAWLNNGIMEVSHAGHPAWRYGQPKVLDWRFAANATGETCRKRWRFACQPRSINKILIRSVRADNAFSALLDMTCNTS